MAEDDVQELNAEERLLQTHKKERKELQGASDGGCIFTTVSSREFLRQFRKAVSVPFSLNQVCSPPVHQFVTTHASSLGCSEKCLFFPLLTCCAACMGVDSYLELTAEWHEPPILWTLILTPTTLRRIDIIEYLQQQLLLVQGGDGDKKFGVVQSFEEQAIKRFIINFFKYSELQDMLINNRGHALGMYSNIQTLKELSTSPLDVEILFKLHNGSSWISCSNNGGEPVMKTSVNFTTFSKPSTLHHLLTKSDPFSDLLQACFLIICAEEKYIKFSQLPTVSSSLTLQRLFYGVLQLHAGANIVYKLSPDARHKFGQIHDEFYERARQASRKNMTGRIFQNALSYLGRLCCILHVLENIVETVNWNLHLDPLIWNTEITGNTVWHARQILNFSLEQRYALLEDYTIKSVVVKHNPTLNTTAISNRITSSSDISVRKLTPQKNSVNKVAINSRENNLPDCPSDSSVDLAIVQANNEESLSSKGEPTIVSVRSAGLPVDKEDIALTSCDTSSSNISGLPPELNLPPSVSLSVISEPGPSTPVNSPSKAVPSSPATPLNIPATSPQLSQPIDWMPHNVFINTYKSQIRRLLTYSLSELTPSRCVQLKLTPDSSSTNSVSDDSKRPKYTCSFARHFLGKLVALGFGMSEGPTRENIRHYLFRKKPIKELGLKQKQMLTDLGINEQEYEKCFWTNTDSVAAVVDGTNETSNGGTEQRDVVVLD